MPKKKDDKVFVPVKEKPKSDPIVKQLLDSLGSIYTFTAGDGRVYARFMFKGTSVVRLLSSRQMSAHVQFTYYQKTGCYATPSSVDNAISFLESSTIESGRTDDVYSRIAHVDGTVYVSLADNENRVVEIDATGWRVVDDCPISFLRTGDEQPLPVPVRGGDIHDLLRVLNIKRSDLPLVVGWIIGCYKPPTPYPILVLNGEQGSGKSNVSRMIRALVDPTATPMTSPPKTEEDLWTNAINSWVYGVENVSFLDEWLSDAFCRLATGAGYKSRKFYTQGTSFTMSAIRPVLINGIGDPGTRSDFLDRSITVTCPLIEPGQRAPERKRLSSDRDGVFDIFDDIYPSMLGLIFDAVSQSLSNSIRLSNVPRMADFALWSAAGISATGIEMQEFLDALANNNRNIHSIAIEQSLVAPALLKYVASFQRGGETTKKYTASSLLDGLKFTVGEDVARNKKFPQTASSLSHHLTRLAPNLRALGVHVYKGEREGSGSEQIRPIFIEITDKYNDDEIRRITGVSLRPSDMIGEEE